MLVVSFVEPNLAKQKSYLIGCLIAYDVLLAQLAQVLITVVRWLQWAIYICTVLSLRHRSSSYKIYYTFSKFSNSDSYSIGQITVGGRLLRKFPSCWASGRSSSSDSSSCPCWARPPTCSTCTQTSSSSHPRQTSLILIWSWPGRLSYDVSSKRWSITWSVPKCGSLVEARRPRGSSTSCSRASWHTKSSSVCCATGTTCVCKADFNTEDRMDRDNEDKITKKEFSTKPTGPSRRRSPCAGVGPPTPVVIVAHSRCVQPECNL